MPHERDAEQPASTWRCLCDSWQTYIQLGDQKRHWGVNVSEHVDALENPHTRSTTQADWLHAPSQLGQG